MWVRVLIAVVMLGASGWQHGRWTGRWGGSPEVARSSAVLAQLPLSIGEWEGRDISAEESEVVARSFTPQIVRRYVHRRDGTVVGLLLTCGRPAAMLLEHTPRTCYTRTGFEEISPEVRFSLSGEGGPGGEFLAHTFGKSSNASTTRVRLFWAWGDRASWSSPEEPRFRLGHKPVLFKLYVTRELGSEEEPVTDDPAVPFLKALIPELQRAVNAPSE